MQILVDVEQASGSQVTLQLMPSDNKISWCQVIVKLVDAKW